MPDLPAAGIQSLEVCTKWPHICSSLLNCLYGMRNADCMYFAAQHAHISHYFDVPVKMSMSHMCTTGSRLQTVNYVHLLLLALVFKFAVERTSQIGFQGLV